MAETEKVTDIDEKKNDDKTEHPTQPPVEAPPPMRTFLLLTIEDAEAIQSALKVAKRLLESGTATDLPVGRKQED